MGVIVAGAVGRRGVFVAGAIGGRGVFAGSVVLVAAAGGPVGASVATGADVGIACLHAAMNNKVKRSNGSRARLAFM